MLITLNSKQAHPLIQRHLPPSSKLFATQVSLKGQTYIKKAASHSFCKKKAQAYETHGELSADLIHSSFLHHLGLYKFSRYVH